MMEAEANLIFKTSTVLGRTTVFSIRKMVFQVAGDQMNQLRDDRLKHRCNSIEYSTRNPTVVRGSWLSMICFESVTCPIKIKNDGVEQARRWKRKRVKGPTMCKSTSVFLLSAALGVLAV